MAKDLEAPKQRLEMGPKARDARLPGFLNSNLILRRQTEIICNRVGEKL